jgi:hypothetical protein
MSTLLVSLSFFEFLPFFSLIFSYFLILGFAYNPRKDSWARISPMNRERCRFTLIPCGKDKLVAIGGSGRVHSDYHFEMNGKSNDFGCFSKYL